VTTADHLDITIRTEPTMSLDVDQITSEAALDVTGEPDTAGPSPQSQPSPRRIRWKRVVAYGLLPGLALILALGAGYLQWLSGSAQQSRYAATESVQAATESTIGMLSYQPDTVDHDLGAATGRLTGSFRDDYIKLIDDVVIPGSAGKRIGSVATVPAAASVSATESHAVVLVFVNLTTTIGDGTPTSTLSSVRVTLDKVGNRWLVSQFDPV